ncbi:MAG: hypothetical protein HZA79_08975 [Sphingobacteriales bacterium]|nr:hypothetical protein [Sphingobacteriales bacterium]
MEIGPALLYNNMKTARILIWTLLPVIILFSSITLCQLFSYTGKEFVSYSLVFPKDRGTPVVFTEKHVWELAAKKKKIRLTLTGNIELNRKKFDLILYETRKMKYTHDSTMVIITDFTSDTPFSEFLKIVRICNDEMIMTYAPVKKGFIIFGYFRDEND